MPPRSNKDRQVQSARNKLRSGERLTKAPAKNIGDQVGGWLGGAAKVVGRAAAQNPIVAENIRYGKAVAAGPTQLAKTVATDLAFGAAGAVAGKAAQVGGRVVSKAYKAAKKTSSPSRTVLFHGGPVELKGGVINPSFVRGDVSSGRISGNVAALNQQSLDRVPYIRSRMEDNIKFVENALTDPTYFSPADRVEQMARIKKSREQITRLDTWAEKAKKENYFTGVGSAKETYAHEGAIHVINPKRKDVTTLLGPGGEYQVAGTQKPIASFSTSGRPGEQMDTAMRLAQQTADKLRKKLERQAVVKQTAKNLIPKRK